MSDKDMTERLDSLSPRGFLVSANNGNTSLYKIPVVSRMKYHATFNVLCAPERAVCNKTCDNGCWACC